MPATPTTTLKPITGNNFIDASTNGYYWILDSTRTVSWAMADGFIDEFWKSSSTQKSQFDIAFKIFSSYADIKFSYAGHYDNPIAAGKHAQIVISLDASNLYFNSSLTWARGAFPGKLWDTVYGYSGSAGDIYFNLSSGAYQLTSYAPGTTGFALFLHEIGHTLGLKHPHDSGGTSHPTFTSLGIAGLDTDWFSLMSYNDDYSWNKLQWEPITPMALDVLGLMSIYGPNKKTNAGNTTINLSDVDGYITVWDASGNDTLNLSSNSEGWTLKPELIDSGVQGIKIGFTAPSSSVSDQPPTSLWWLLGSYENAIGTSYGDELWGTASSNNIKGGYGNDLLVGLAGADTIDGGGGYDSIFGGDGSDKLTGGSSGDQFWFNSRVGIDLISDFTLSEGDTFVFYTPTFTSLAYGIYSWNVRIGSNVKTAITPYQYLIFDTSGGKLYYDADGSYTYFNAVQIAGVKGSFSGITVSSFDAYSG